MPRSLFSLATALALVLAAGCDGQEPAPPLFAPGDYGGDPLPGTEEFWNVRVSPGGEHVSLMRLRTPGEQVFDPRYQLWLTERDGTNPELLSVFASGADWSPDGERLAVTRVRGIDFYVHTLDLATRTARQWTGLPHQRLSEGTAGNPKWFADGRRLLVDVAQRSYQMPYERGAYVVDTETGQTSGPLLELFENTSLGDGERFIIGQKFVYDLDHPRQGNAVRYDRATGAWDWITAHDYDDLDIFVQSARASPTADLVVQARVVENAWQLFLMDSHGEGVRQITTLGGDDPDWSYDGRRIYFRRDVHRGPGARYVPYVYDLDTATAAPLWPALADSLPAFPPLGTQTPISLTDTPPPPNAVI